jgi:sugar lactone lactonase YvrE
VRIDPTRRWLYTNETLAARLLRYPTRADGSLGEHEVLLDLDESNMFDGFTLDSEGGAWITALVSNRLWHFSPQ